MPETYCPSCGADIRVKKPREGSKITCPDCDAELEVISTDPFEVDFPLDEDGKWEDEDDAWEDEG
jgi:lysine biosynthesis protein LysW